MTPRIFAAVLAALLAASPAAGQAGLDPFLRGVPTGPRSDGTLSLTLADAVTRGLTANLGVLLENQRVRSAEGGKLRALGEVLPHVSASVRDSEQVVNLAAFGFTGFPGIPDLIGPFGVFDARVSVSAPLFDAAALGDWRAGGATLRAEQFAGKNTREIVILIVANLYLEAVADASRVESTRSQVATAETLLRLATDQKTAGIVAGIDVVRQQVQLESARQRMIVAENAFAKQKLRLARAIGLQPGQAFDLADKIPYKPAPAISLDAGIAQASANRDDVKSAEARADAARAARASARAGSFPTVRFDADYGRLGTRASDAKSTYTVAASLRVPLFSGGAVRGRLEQADAELRQREAELADLRAGIHYEVESAILDVTSATAAVEVARSTEALARQQLEQAQDRFRAGVSSTIELAQAQDAMASASDGFIVSLYAHNLAKASLARALGLVEERFAEFVGGAR